MQKLKRSDLRNSLRKIRVSVMKFLSLYVFSIFSLHYLFIIKVPLGNVGISWQHEVKCLNSQEFQMKFLLRTNYVESHSLKSLQQRKIFRRLATDEFSYSACEVHKQAVFITAAKKLIIVRTIIHELFAQLIIS